ncbi:unnamed protein product [Lepidochelys kempii]
MKTVTLTKEGMSFLICELLHCLLLLLFSFPSHQQNEIDIISVSFSSTQDQKRLAPFGISECWGERLLYNRKSSLVVDHDASGKQPSLEQEVICLFLYELYYRAQIS